MFILASSQTGRYRWLEILMEKIEQCEDIYEKRRQMERENKHQHYNKRSRDNFNDCENYILNSPSHKPMMMMNANNISQKRNEKLKYYFLILNC